LKVLEFPVPDDACRYLETIAPDAVVVDAHHPDLKAPVGALGRLLRLVSSAGQRGRRLPLVVLNSPGMSEDVRTSFLDAGGFLVPTGRQAHRHVVRLTRLLCGLHDECCNVRDADRITL
jgi:hypothetical protein